VRILYDSLLHSLTTSSLPPFSVEEIRVNVGPGAQLTTAYRWAVALANLTEVPVRFVFNGRIFRATPSEAPPLGDAALAARRRGGSE